MPRLASVSLAVLMIVLLASALLSLRPGELLAKNQIRQAFFAAYPSAVGSRLDNLPSISGHCGVCHYRFTGGGNRNLFGSRVESALDGFPNNDTGRRQAILSIEGEDPDGDGFSSLTEATDVSGYANTPTFPGLTAANVGSVSNVNVNEILAYLTPQAAGDVTPPQVTISAPNGGQSWTGGTPQTVQWNATDNIGVASVDLFYRDSESGPWKMIANGLPNSGSFAWSVHNTPSSSARVQAVARDLAGNQSEDMGDANFTIVQTPGGTAPTTLRDFEQPGSQPFSSGTFEAHQACYECHGGYDAAVEPGHGFRGSMMAQAGRDPLFFACLAIAEQDAPSSGDMCLRCHSPFGWLGGRSQPTDGVALSGDDFDGVSCDFCHRLVDPVYQVGVSPSEDQEVLGALLPAHAPTGYANGQFVVDPNHRRRGPFADALSPHGILESPFHRASDMCGTCHDVSNPVFDRVAGADYAPGPLDQAATSISSATLMPLERTFSEWSNSSYPAGVYAPEFAGDKPDGVVASCQDCHMSDATGRGCNDAGAPLRGNLPLHDLTGGSAWMPGVIAALFPGEVDAAALADAQSRAVSILQRAAVLDVVVEAQGDSFRAEVTVTNRTGHKLPTGYPEGRRVWLHVVGRDEGGAVVYESGGYDAATGVLSHDPDVVIYENELGISPALATALGLAAGPSFHFVLNDTVYKDNRIPPLGFSNAAFEVFGGAPVDPSRPGLVPRYADGQNWDVSNFALPANARSVSATLYYQSTSKEYVEFLRDENTTNSAGQEFYDLWVAHGRAAPVAMVGDSLSFVPTAVAEPRGEKLALQAISNPFHGQLEMRLDLPRAAAVTMQVFDVHGRRIGRTEFGMLGGGAHRLRWDGRDASGRAIDSGTYWVTVDVAGKRLGRRVVKLR